MNLWIGTSGWQYPAWKGDFYPEKISAPKMLPYYAERFSSTEINYTFRHLPSAKSIANWSAQTPEAFRFSFKASQRITHTKRLRDCAHEVTVLHAAIAPMGKKLGPMLFQLPPTLQKNVPLLAEFLGSLPDGLRAAFEFRHLSWFSEEVYSTLHLHGAALCLAEDEKLATPPVPTAGFGYLRLRREDYQNADLKKWAKFIQQQEGRWSDVYVYFKHEDTGLGPRFAAEMQRPLKHA